jgi:hypothetical protein
MAFTKKSAPAGMMTLESIDKLAVGTTIYKVYPPKNGGMICKGVITRAPHFHEMGGSRISESLWIELDHGTSLFTGKVSLSDCGICREPYNTNRMFLNEEDAIAYLEHENFVLITDEHGKTRNVSKELHNVIFGGSHS